MYITCPSCSTSYEVDGTQIGPKGRTVRCFNCQHSWQQYPAAAQSQRPAPQTVVQSPRYVPQSQQRGYAEAAYGRGSAQPAAPAYGGQQPQYFEPEPAPARPGTVPRPEPVTAALPPKPAPQPEPKVEPAPTPADDDDDRVTDADLEKMFGPNQGERDDAASRMFAGASAEDETTDLDEEKIAEFPDPEPLREVYGGNSNDDDDLVDDIEPEELPDPDPIPAVYGGSDDDEDDEDFDEKGSGLRKLIAPAVTIVAIGAIVAGVVLAREPIVKLWPSANEYVYDLAGLHVMLPGEGLKRELTRTAMETVAEVDHVIATGLVTNVSDKEQPLPQVVIQLIDANEKVLSSKTMTLEKASLQPGEVLQFKAVFDDAPATARKVRTEWGGFADPQAPQQPEQH